MLVSNQRCHLVQIVRLVQSVVRLVLRWVQSVLRTINRVQHGKPIRVIAAASPQMVRDNISKHFFFLHKNMNTRRSWKSSSCYDLSANFNEDFSITVKGVTIVEWEGWRGRDATYEEMQNDLTVMPFVNFKRKSCSLI